MSDKRPILTYEAQINRVLPGLIPEIREQVLADAKDRIEGLVHKEQGFDNADMEYGYGRGLAESIRALDALTQPQTDGCPNSRCEGGMRPNGEGGRDVCPDCLEAANADGGGSGQSPSGVPDGDLAARIEAIIEDHIGSPHLPPPQSRDEWGPVCAGCGTDEFRIDGYCSCECRDSHEFARELRAVLPPAPYTKAFRERVCPVPEFPGIEKEES